MAATHAIEAQSFSADITPTTLEAILQDADRLDAIAALGGMARCFSMVDRVGSVLCDAVVPQAEGRALDDKRYALEHFPAKLLRRAGGRPQPGRGWRGSGRSGWCSS